MDENKELLELLKAMEKTNRKQLRMARLQCIFSLLAAVCCGAVLLVVLNILPQVDTVMNQLDTVMDQTQTVLGNLEKTTAQLAAVDLESMVTDVDTLVVTGQQSLEQTMDKLNSIDIKTLNQAIEDLAAVVEPMAKFFNSFQR